MNYLILIILWVFNVLYEVSAVAPNNSKLNNYLDEKYDLEKYLLHPKIQLLYKRELGNIKTIYKRQIHAKFFAFDNDDDLYIVLENEVYIVQENNTTYTVVPTKLSLHKIQDSNDIEFFKVVQFENSVMMLAKLKSGEAQIYKFSKDSMEFVHSLSVAESKDAHFFVNNKHLYLVVVNNKGDHMTITSVYKWLGSHFDEIQTIFTIGAIKVSSFSTGKSEILIILQTSQNRTVYSDVFQFKEEKITKIQQLSTENPINLETFGNKGHNFVVVYDSSNNNSIFQWNGRQLYRISQLITENGSFLNIISKLNNRSVILSFQKNKVHIYPVFPAGKKITESIEQMSNIFDIYKTENGSSIVMYVVSSTAENNTHISVISFTMNEQESEIDGGNKDDIHNCFDNLEHSLYAFRKKQNTTKSKLIKFKLIPEAVPTQDQSQSILSQALTKDNDFEDRVQNVEEKLKNITSTIHSYKENEGNNITVNGSLRIRGTIMAEKIFGKNVGIRVLNEEKWTPEQWLKYTEPQTITGPVKFSQLITKHLETTNDPLFQHLLLKTGDQTIFGKTTTKKLIADNLHTEKINGILLNDIYLKNDSEVIKGKKTFNTLTAESAHLKTLNGQVPSNFSPPEENYSNLLIDNLEVDNINEISWNDFEQSVFRVGVTDKITGSLSFPKLKTEKLTLETLKNVGINSFFTKNTDQIIEADIEFNRIYANNIEADTVNGIDLNKTAVSFDGSFPIKAPVSFDELYTENLELIGKFDKSLFEKNGDHIVGTNESDLLQNYRGNVKIKGNLILKNLTMLPKSSLFVAEHEVLPNITEIFWTKSTDQTIPVDVTALKGLKVPHMLTTSLNDINFNQYMQANADNNFETDFDFENVTVFGNVMLASTANNKPDLNKLNKEAIKLNGSYNVKGRKIYSDKLKIENLVANELNGIKIFEAVNKKYPVDVNGTKTFKNLIIQEDLTASIEHVDILNNKDISKWNETVISISLPQNLTSLHFKDLRATHLNVKNINGHPVEDYISKLDAVKTVKKISNLIIQQNLTINNARNVSTINEIKFQELLNKSTSKVDKSGRIPMDITFTGKIKIENLATNFINDIDLEKLTSKLLYRDAKQNITGLYKFKKLKADNLKTLKINEIVMNNLIDIKNRNSQLVMAPGGVELNSIKFLRSLHSDNISPCNMKELLKHVQNPTTQNWNKVNVAGNVTLKDQESPLYRVFEKSVRNSKENIILAPVIFAKSVSAPNIYSKNNINNVDILKIAEDAVLKQSSDEQVISGHKWFNSVHLNTAVVEKNADIPFVNNEDINNLNYDIVDKNEINNILIKGMKTFFGGLQANRFYGETLNDVEVKNVVDLENPKKVPRVVFDRLKIIDNLNVSFINNFNFSHILENRLLLRGSKVQILDAIYYFQDVEIENMTTSAINKIKIDDVVFDDQQQQNISGRKFFMNKIEILGDMRVDFINNVDISKEYEHSFIDNNLVTVNGSMTVLLPTLVNGSISTEYINGFPVAGILEILATRNTGTEIEEIDDAKNKTIEIIKRNTPIVQDLSAEYLYLEKSDAFQVSVPNTISASTMTSKGYVLIHIIGENNGTFCSLPSHCMCPFQHTIGVSPERSITDFPNKGSQRIFSYDDGSMVIHFITNSVSRSSECRTDTIKVINEVSMMSWNTLSTTNKSGSFFQYDDVFRGYISKVEFFTLENTTYVIVGKYFDPVTESYNLDSVVIKFSEDRTTAEEIQKIPTKGVEELYLLHTAQGVILVIGNIKNDEEETYIYLFNAITEQFELLRTIPWFGCSGAAGVVFDTDSLIVLRHRFAPVQILKYNPQFNNYYHYQSFILEEPVVGMTVFYSAGFGISDAYMCMVTSNENYYVYTYRFIEGWKLVSSDHLEGVRNLIPLELNDQVYLFAPSKNNSVLLTVIKNGSL